MRMRYDQFSPVPPLTRVTKYIIITCVSVFFIDLVLSSLTRIELISYFGLIPAMVRDGYVYQLLTYIFLHGNPLHILLNMLILWYFGAEIEMRMGEWGFLKYFLLCGIGAGALNFGVNILTLSGDDLLVPIIGASGAVYAVLVAYGIFFGERYFLVFFIFPMKAKYFVMIIAAIELLMGLKPNPEQNVAHFAHLGGMLVGAIYIYFTYIRPSSRGGRRDKRDIAREKLKRQFKLIVNQGDDEGGGGDNSGPTYWN